MRVPEEDLRTVKQIGLSLEEEMKSIRKMLEEIVFEAAKRGLNPIDSRETR